MFAGAGRFNRGIESEKVRLLREIVNDLVPPIPAMALYALPRRLCLTCSPGRDEAVSRFRGSQLFQHLESLKKSTLREQTGGFDSRNLIGSPAVISERIRTYQRVGVTTFAGMLFVANTVAEMQEAIELFGQEVLPNFR